MLNKFETIGYLGRDPDIKIMDTGLIIAQLNIACTEKYKEKEQTNWFRASAFGKKDKPGLTKVIKEYLKKGSRIYIEGSLRENKYEKDGVKVYGYNIIIQRLIMLGGGNRNGNGNGNGRKEKTTDPSKSNTNNVSNNNNIDDDNYPEF